MKLTVPQLFIINHVIQLDSEGKTRQYNLSDLSLASDIFNEIKKRVENENLTEGEVKLTSEQKVFITKSIDERTWGVGDADTVFGLKKLLK